MHIIDLFDYCRVKIDFFIHSNIKKKKTLLPYDNQ